MPGLFSRASLRLTWGGELVRGQIPFCAEQTGTAIDDVRTAESTLEASAQAVAIFFFFFFFLAADRNKIKF